MTTRVRSGISYFDATNSASKYVAERLDPIRESVFSDVTADPVMLAEALTLLQRGMVEGTRAARSNRRNQARVYVDVACGTAGAAIRLEHRLGRLAQWSVINWKRSTPGGWHGLEESAVTGDLSDENTLVLVSYVAGTATIEVF